MDVGSIKSFELDGGIVLRAHRSDDAEAVYNAVIANLDHLREYMHWAVPDYSLDHAREFIAASIKGREERTSLGFGIFKGMRPIGSIGFVNFDHAAARTEIGYWIDKDHEGQGIISMSCRSLINYAFEELKMNRIEIRCSTENVRSAAIPLRYGFTLEGTLRQSEIRNGRLHDFAVFGLLASEWKVDHIIGRAG